MRRFGVPELVPQEPSNMSLVGTMGVSRLGLATTTGTDRSMDLESNLNFGSAGRQHDPETLRTSIGAIKRPLEPEAVDVGADKRHHALKGPYAGTSSGEDRSSNDA